MAALGPFLGRPWPLLGGPWPLLAAPRTTQMAPKWVPRRTLLAIPVFGSFSIDFYSELRPPKTKKSLKFIGFYNILAFPAFCNLHPFWLRFGCQLGSILPPKIVQKIVQGASWRRPRASWAALGDSCKVLGRCWAALGPSCAALWRSCAVLGRSWPIFGGFGVPIWGPRGGPRTTFLDTFSALEPTWPRAAPQEPSRPPKPSPQEPCKPLKPQFLMIF